MISITEEILRRLGSRELAHIGTLCVGIIADRIDNKILIEAKVKNGK